jgi:hypothetical protein
MSHGAMLFKSFFEPPQLVFHLFDRAIQGCKHSFGLGDGHKFVVVLGPHAQLQNSPLGMLQIGRDRNCSQAIEEFSHYLDFFPDFILRRRAQMTVPGRNGRLHAAVSTS